MNLAIKFYRNEIDKPIGIPDGWPSEVIELGDSLILPNDQYILMTLEQYNEYIIDNRPNYDIYISSIIIDNSLQQAQACMVFGQMFIAQLGAEPEVMSLNTDQMIQLVSLTGSIQLMLMTGALGTALFALENTDFTGVLSSDLITKYLTKLKQFLGVE